MDRGAWQAIAQGVTRESDTTERINNSVFSSGAAACERVRVHVAKEERGSRLGVQTDIFLLRPQPPEPRTVRAGSYEGAPPLPPGPSLLSFPLLLQVTALGSLITQAWALPSGVTHLPALNPLPTDSPRVQHMGLRVASQKNPLVLNKAAGQPDSRLPGRGVCGPAVAAASRRLSGTKCPHTISCKRRPTQLICGGYNRTHYCKPAALGTRSRSLPRLETCICCHGFAVAFILLLACRVEKALLVSLSPPSLPSFLLLLPPPSLPSLLSLSCLSLYFFSFMLLSSHL